jgi:hypothetical protein
MKSQILWIAPRKKNNSPRKVAKENIFLRIGMFIFEGDIFSTYLT